MISLGRTAVPPPAPALLMRLHAVDHVPQLIQFEGVQHQFPDDFTHADIQRALSSVAPATPAASAIPPLPPGFVLDQPAAVPPLPPGFTLDPPQQAAPAPAGPPAPPISQPDNVQAITIRPVRENRPASLLPSSVSGATRDFTVGAQGVGKGISHIVTGPFDLMGRAEPRDIRHQQGVRHRHPAGYTGVEAGGAGRRQAQSTVGSMLAARAPEVLAQTTRSPSLPSRTLDSLAKPYKDAPTRTLTGDAIGGAGAGVGVNAADNLLPEHPANTSGKILKETAGVIAPLVGGMGANTIQSAVEGVAGMLRNIATRAFTSAPREIPLNPNTKAPYSNSDVDRAATRLQAGTTGSPTVLAQDIRENAGALSNPTRPGETPVDASALPTTGLLSRDPGLVTLEGGARSKAAPDFIQRDNNVKEAAGNRVEAVRDPDADLGAVFRRAGDARDERIGSADSAIEMRANESAALERIRQDEGASFGVVANTDAKARASGRLDRTVVEQGYVPARTEKNRQFDQAPGRHDQLPADEVFTAIDRVRAGLNGLAPGTMPVEFVQRLDRLRPRIVDGENVGGPGTANGADLADLRKYLSVAERKAQQGGNFDLADNVRVLRTSINRTIDEAPGYAEANANYGQFADRYRPEPNDEMAKFTRELDRNGNTDGLPNRGATPPSQTAGRFLSAPEKAAALHRVLEGAPNAAAGQAAVRDYLRSDFAMSALNPDGSLNAVRASSWARNNADVLAQMPALRQEFDSITATARRGQQMSTEARDALEQARASRQATEVEIDRSAVGTLLREDPRDVASKLLNGGYNAGRKLDEITALVKNDAQARRGWKAAVAEVLTDKVQGSRMVGEAPEVQFARLVKEFKDNEVLLSKTFSPEEMNGLRQAHTILGYFKEAEKRATVGSNTADKWNVPGWAQLAVRHFKGDLAGGGLIKRFKLLLEQLPDNRQSADEIVHMAWFNPDVAAYLLERPVTRTWPPTTSICDG
jgi:hypothetical protein